MVRPSRLVLGKKFFQIWFIYTHEGCVLVLHFFLLHTASPRGLLGNTSQEDEATVPSPNILEALTVTMGEEVREEELVDVPQRQLGARVDIDNDNLDKEQKRKMLEGVEEGDLMLSIFCTNSQSQECLFNKHLHSPHPRSSWESSTRPPGS